MSASRRPMAVRDVRRHHLSLVVESLLSDGPCSRAELSERVGLTKATVSALVADLVGRGLLAEHDAKRQGRIGRPGADVEVQASRIGALGLELRVHEVTACVVDLGGSLRTLHRERSDNRRARPTVVVERLSRVARAALDEAADEGIRCVGGTLAVPGLVDPSTRALVVAPNLDWHDVVLAPLGDQLGQHLDVENEAQLAALAELRHGVGEGLSSFAYVSAGVGVGGGVVLDRALVRGSHGFAAEIGHVVVDPQGPVCACGARGCLEAVIGGDASAPAEVICGALTAAFRTVVHVLDPQAIVLGGALAELDDDVVGGIEDRLRSQTLGGRSHPCDLRRSTLGPHAALIGAATSTLDALVADPTHHLAASAHA